MKVALIQHDIQLATPAANRQQLSLLMQAAEAADLYVLPEMFSTGFVTDPQGVAEPVEPASLQWMRQQAVALDAAVAGSIAVADAAGHYYNRLYFVTPDGSHCHYDKRHLFSYGGEHRHYTPGDRRVVVHWRGVRFLLQVCYDLRFPVWSRSQGDYDAVLYVANWPAPRIAVWDTLLQARAIENQCYAIGVNRTGSDATGSYPGHSCVVDARGHVVARCPDDAPCTLTATLDMAALAAFRHKFPVLSDRENFDIQKA